MIIDLIEIAASYNIIVVDALLNPMNENVVTENVILET